MYSWLKGFIGIFISVIALIIIWPIFLFIAVLIKVTSPGPVFFRQDRFGKNKELFQIYKFRTMRVDAPKDMPTHLLERPDAHITKIGKFLRKSSLDEIPQILNIIKGEMNIVGPRPALWNQYDLIAERDKYGANDIKPGLTGWAQINGRDELPIDIKAKLDGEYVKLMGFLFDIKIIIKTALGVLRSEGIKEGTENSKN
ncbi:MAG: gumD [Bacillales bacterium]|jgi:O-antigen biosynthesis protein WbqP|nr:gumD [Bacillales bacterium]